MSVALASSIAVAIAGKPVRLTFTATAGNFVRVWCTAAPTGSKLRTKLDADKSARIHVVDLDSGRPFEYTFEAAGAYQFAAAEFTKGAAPYGGGYQFSPNSAPAEKALGETPLAFYVAVKLKATLGIGGDTADLILYGASSVIQATTLAVHGVASPAVEKPRTDKAKTAAGNAALLAALAALPGTSGSVAVGDASTLATDFIDKFNEHILSTSFHDTGDGASNRISSAYRNPTTPEALKQTLGQILKALSAHIRNDSVVSPHGTGTASWHQIDGAGVVDWTNLPLFESTASVGEHLRGLADAHRSFEAHRISSAHLTSDTVNELNALPPLLGVHALFLAQLAAFSPTVPATDNSVKTVLVHSAGFEEI